MNNKVKIYIGCSLTHSPVDFKAAVEDLKASLRKQYEVFDFIGLDKGTSRDVYMWDIKKCVAGCDLFVAICDHASIGLGYELGVAVEAYNKPVLAVADEATHLTRLVEGIDSPKFSLVRYKSLSEIEELISNKLKSLN